jgi:hypothetical protein
MSSLTRRMQRMPERVKHKNPLRFGAMLGVNNPKATDLIARLEREKRRKNK